MLKEHHEMMTLIRKSIQFVQEYECTSRGYTMQVDTSWILICSGKNASAMIRIDLAARQNSHYRLRKKVVETLHQLVQSCKQAQLDLNKTGELDEPHLDVHPQENVLPKTSLKNLKRVSLEYEDSFIVLLEILCCIYHSSTKPGLGMRLDHNRILLSLSGKITSHRMILQAALKEADLFHTSDLLEPKSRNSTVPHAPLQRQISHLIDQLQTIRMKLSILSEHITQGDDIPQCKPSLEYIGGDMNYAAHQWTRLVKEFDTYSVEEVEKPLSGSTAVDTDTEIVPKQVDHDPYSSLDQMDADNSDTINDTVQVYEVDVKESDEVTHII